MEASMKAWFNVSFQIWSSSFLPNEARVKHEKQKQYFEKHGKPMLMDYVKKELIKEVQIYIGCML